jgi:hypothetical protein
MQFGPIGMEQRAPQPHDRCLENVDNAVSEHRDLLFTDQALTIAICSATVDCAPGAGIFAYCRR